MPRGPCDMPEPCPATGVHKDCPVPGEQLSQDKAVPGIPLQQRVCEIEEDMANPISHPPRPLPCWLEEQQLCDWEKYSKADLYSLRETEGYKEPSVWEESIGQGLSEEENSVGQEFSKGNGDRLSVQSIWEDNSDKELAQDNWKCVRVQSIGVKALLWEEDDWDKLSVLELPEQEDREQRLGCFAGDGLPVPVPWEAWVEHQAFEPCPQVPFCAWPPQSPGPALHSCSSPSAPQLPAKGPCKKRLSHIRWALWVMCSPFCCPWPYLAPLPED
nr:uncharacterized protein LOC102072260 [Zonotrichia albicollis]